MKFRFLIQLESFDDDDEDMWQGREIQTDEFHVDGAPTTEAELIRVFEHLCAELQRKCDELPDPAPSAGSGAPPATP